MKLTAANMAIRARNVTASEVGALLGEHPYTTPGAIWDRLMAPDAPGRPQTAAMAFGSETEPIMRRMAERALGAVLRANSRTYEHPRVRLCATPDAIVLRSSGLLAFRGDLVEFKTSWSHWRWQHGLPPDIEWQCRAQMACTHKSRVIVYVFSGRESIYTVERHRGKERRMTQAVERFWTEHVETGIRPAEVGETLALTV